MAIKSKKSYFGVLILLISIPFWILLIIAVLAQFIPPYKILPPAFVGLAFIWIWLANLILVLLLVIFRIKFSFPGILLLMCTLPFASHHFRFSEKSNIPENSIKILSFNIQNLGSNFGNAFKDELVADSIFKFINSVDADIICLQEFTSTSKDTNEFINNFTKSVKTENYFFQKYSPNSKKTRGLRGLITASKYKMINTNSLIYDSRYFGTYSDIVIKSDTIRVFNFHLQTTNVKQLDIDLVNNPIQTKEAQKKSKSLYRKMGIGFNKRARESQIAKNAMNESPYPIIVCGDFNDTPCSYSYYKISKTLKDSFVESGKGFGKTYNGDLPLMRIDYILHDYDYSATNFTVHQNFYSDHFPISTNLTKKK